jgi:hypothetical protein
VRVGLQLNIGEMILDRQAREDRVRVVVGWLRSDDLLAYEEAGAAELTDCSTPVRRRIAASL